MRDIAFKTASVNPNLKGVLPDAFITEFTYVDLHPPGTLSVKDGWQFESDETFLPKWEKNDLLVGNG